MVVLLVISILTTVAAFDGLAPLAQTVTPKAELNSYVVPEEQNNGDYQVKDNLPNCPNTAILLRALNVLTDSLAKDGQEIDINKVNYILKLLENLHHSPLDALEDEYKTVVINVKSLIDNLSQNKDAMRSSSRKDKKKIKITVQYEIPASSKCEDANKQIDLIKHIAQHSIPGSENFKVTPDEAQSLIPSQDNEDSETDNQIPNLQYLLHHKNGNSINGVPQNYRPQQSTYEMNENNKILNDPKFQYQQVDPLNGKNNDDYKPIEDNKGLQHLSGIYKNVPIAQNNVNSLPYYVINPPEKRIDPSAGNQLGLLQNPNVKSQLDIPYKDPERLAISQSPYLNPNAISQDNLSNYPNTPKTYNSYLQSNVGTENIPNQATKLYHENYPMYLQNPNQYEPNVYGQNNQNSILTPSKNVQQNRFEFNAKSTDKNRHISYLHNLPNPRYTQTVTNLLNDTQNNNDQLVELTYVLQVPKAVQYQPLYMVKYRLPLKVFQENLNKLLEMKPYLRNDPNRLYQELIVKTNSTNTLSNIPGLKHRELINIISKDGMLVGSKLLNSNETEIKELNTIKELNSNLSSNDILNLNNRTVDKELERLSGEYVLDDSILKGREKLDNHVSYQQVKTKENEGKLIRYVQPETKMLPLTKFVTSNIKYYPFQRPMVQPFQQIQSA